VARVTVDLSGDRLTVGSPDGFGGQELKDLGARRESLTLWSLPAAAWLLRWLIEAIPQAELSEAAAGVLGAPRAVPVEHPRAADLYPFQREAAGILAGSGGLLLAMSPGLGKTPTAIVAADAVRAPERGVLVVAPRSLLPNWRREIEAWSVWPFAAVAHGSRPEAIDAGGWTLTTYETYVRRPAWFARPGGWPLAILDESVLVKSRGSKRFKAFSKARTTGAIGEAWLLSGSPVTRHADDLWAQLHLIRPKAFPSYWRFAERFCRVEATPWARTVAGSRARVDPRAENPDLVHAVSQDDVLDLPEYLFEDVAVELGPRQRRAYDDMLREFRAELDGAELTAASKAARLVRLLQLASGLGSLGATDSAKHDALVEMIESGAYDGPHLVWAHWREDAANLVARLRRARLAVDHVHGGLDDAARDAAIQRYKDGRTEALVMSMGVGKYGHTLTGTRTIWYVDRTWNADDYVQSLRRVRRIGLDHRPVVVTLSAIGTADELVQRNLSGKMGTIARMTNGGLKELLAGLGG
jgi:SNF2 family DNA or RNA helicase